MGRVATERAARGLRRVVLAALVAASASLLPAPLGAQAAHAPFETLRLELGGLRGLGGDLLGAWEPARGVYLLLASPWAGGELTGRLEIARHRALPDAPGDLDEVHALAGWARAVSLAGPLALRLGGELGIDYFRLPREENALETEVMAGLGAGLVWSPGPAWSLELALLRRWTFTDPGLRRDAVTLGIGRRVSLPEDVRRTLGGSPDLPPRGTRPPRTTSRPDALPAPPPAGPRWPAALADVPGWTTATVDGMTVGVAPPGAPSSEAGRVAVRVDGWEVPVTLLGVLAPDRLPVEPPSVAAVRSIPGAAAGRPGVDAVLDVTTRPAPAGLSAWAAAHGANATGDGGPRALVEGEGPNVESLEWGYGVGAAWGTTASEVRAEASQHRRWVSELPVFFRNFEAVDPAVRWPWVEVLRGRVAGRAAAGPLRGRATVAASRADDFLRLPGLPREVPVASTLGAGWLQGEASAGAWTLGASLGRASQTVEAAENRLGRALDWRESTTTGRISARRGRGGLALTLERRSTEGGESLTDPTDRLARVEADLAFGPGPGRPATALAASVLRTDGRWGGSASATIERSGDASATGLRVSAEVAPAASRDGFWLAEARGLRLLERWGIDGPSVDAPLPPLRRATVEAWHRRGAPSAWLELRGRVDRADGWWLPRVDVVAEDRVPAVAGPLELTTDASGVVGWAGLRYGWSLGALDGWGDHAVRGPFGGGSVLEEAHASLPRHRSVHHVRWRPSDDVALGARLEARSGTRHEGFRGAGPLFPADLPGAAWLDLGATKGLLEGRAALEIVVRDVLDREARTHPLAGTPGLTLEVLGRVRLGSQPRPESSPPDSSASRRR